MGICARLCSSLKTTFVSLARMSHAHQYNLHPVKWDINIQKLSIYLFATTCAHPLLVGLMCSKPCHLVGRVSQGSCLWPVARTPCLLRTCLNTGCWICNLVYRPQLALLFIGRSSYTLLRACTRGVGICYCTWGTVSHDHNYW